MSVFLKESSAYIKVIANSPGNDALVFQKRFEMLSQCLVQSMTKKIIYYLLVLGQQPLIVLQIQNFH